MKLFNTGQPHYITAVFGSDTTTGKNYYLSVGIFDEPTNKRRPLKG